VNAHKIESSSKYIGRIMQQRTWLKLLIGSVGAVSSFACGSGSKKSEVQIPTKPPLIRSDYSPAELKSLCEEEIKKFTGRLDRLSQNKAKPMSFANSFGELENASDDFQENLGPLTFMYSVSTNADVRKASQDCDSQSSQASIEVFSRRDLFNVMKAAQSGLKTAKLDEAEQRLITETMRGFKLSGLELSDEKLEKFKKLKKEMADLSTQFHGNLNNNVDVAEMTEAEMAGLSDNVKARFKKLPNGNYQVPAKTTFYVDFIENASNADARKKMLQVYDNREAKVNTELLQKTIRLRREAAKLIGFKDWADYKTYDKMAKNGNTAWEFLQNLKGRLKKAYQKDYQQILAFKKELDPKATKVDPWDGAYLSNQLRKKKYAVDNEVLREYFPSEHVIGKMFELYSQLLGVRYVPVENANVWHPSVRLYEVRDEKTGDLLAYFFMDLYPREGKYGHAAAFTLRSGREAGGKYLPPISALVTNLTPANGDRPSLLSHEEVETLFHEFGHVMHSSLTRVKFASLSGTSVAWDFVEAPSQMLENWPWQPEILKAISAHYKDPTQKMPDDLIQKLVSSRKFNQSWIYTRQLSLGIYDMTLHRSLKDLDVTETYKNVYRELTGMEPLADTHFPATFGHLMGGYDAGYYGYMWSNVFAFDMFTKFEDGHLRSPEVGMRYRKAILEQGNLRDADVLLKEFLGRKANTDAFFRYLGLKI
jgi:thimet oligopeptidase